MGKEFVALIDAIPEDTEADFEKLVEKFKDVLPEECTLETYEVQPVAFGLKKARLRI
ncbi:MAG: elongation factor 1-beta, partial [Promethearchaeota archaeon]